MLINHINHGSEEATRHGGDKGGKGMSEVKQKKKNWYKIIDVINQVSLNWITFKVFVFAEGK